MVQWLGLCVSNAGGAGSMPGCGTKIPTTCSKAITKKQKHCFLTILSPPLSVVDIIKLHLYALYAQKHKLKIHLSVLV